MEDVKKEVEETTEKTTEENSEKHNTFTQDDVNNVVAKNVKEAREKLLKELGVEEFDDAKKAVKDLKQRREAEMTEAERLKKHNEELTEKISQFETEKRNTNLKTTVNEVLSSMEVDTSKSSVIMKLVDQENLFEDGELNKNELQSRITKTLKEELPELIKTKKVGVEQKEAPTKSDAKSYLNDKYKNNPYYKG